MATRSLYSKVVAVAGALLLILFIHLAKRASTIPPDFQFQAHFSRRQAEWYYAQASKDLRHTYWHDLRLSLTHLQLKHAWSRITNGQGHIEGVLTNANSDVVVFVRFKNGDNFWLTVQTSLDHGLARRQ